MHRKDFIKTCGIVCIGTTAFGILSGCASTNYFAQFTLSDQLITIKKSEFILVTDDKKTERKYVLVKTNISDFPLCIYKLDDNTYSALLMECTHKSCELRPQGSYLVCPCHGSEFTNLGIVQNPPAEQNLKTFKITSDHEYIYVHL